MKTHLPKINVDQRKWHVIDANGAILGRLAVQIADTLRGKNKPVFTPHLDAGDFVVVINAEKVVVTGKKEEKNSYMFFSGYVGGETYRKLSEQRVRHPEFVIEHAVKGMLPKNRLAATMLTKLRVFAGSEHTHTAQNPETISV